MAYPYTAPSMRGGDEPIKSVLGDDVISMYSILSSCRTFSTLQVVTTVLQNIKKQGRKFDCIACIVNLQGFTNDLSTAYVIFTSSLSVVRYLVCCNQHIT